MNPESLSWRRAMAPTTWCGTHGTRKRKPLVDEPPDIRVNREIHGKTWRFAGKNHRTKSWDVHFPWSHGGLEATK